MAPPRRMSPNGSKQRELLVEAAEAILKEEGYAAVSARQVTTRAGLKSQLLYYYFENMDDLFVAVVQRITDRREELFAEALAAPAPLQKIWDLNNDPSLALLSAELIALAGHREAVRTRIIQTAKDFRARQVAAVADLLRRKGVDLAVYPPEAVVMILTAIGRTIHTEEALGLDDCHGETLGLVRALIERLS